MDKKKKISTAKQLFLCFLIAITCPLKAQVSVEIGTHEISQDKDSITLFMNILENGTRIKPEISDLQKLLVIKEEDTITEGILKATQKGKGISNQATFSLLIDRNLLGEESIRKAVDTLVKLAPDSCVYISFYSDDVTNTVRVKKNEHIESLFDQYKSTVTTNKHFYSALYKKIEEFDRDSKCMISERSKRNTKNYLFVFTEANQKIGSEDDEDMDYMEVNRYQNDTSTDDIIRPRIFAFYYNPPHAETNEDIKDLLEGITQYVPEGRRGNYMEVKEMGSILDEFYEVLDNESFDFEFTYKPSKDMYDGDVTYQAFWNQKVAGTATLPIASKEDPLYVKDSERPEVNNWKKYPLALLFTLLTIAFFFFVMKVLIPALRSLLFSVKYYKRYVPEENVLRRTCHFCGQEIHPGDKVVVRCKHIMHVHCWKQNGYRCGEYGQNCKEGIQEHVAWSNMFSPSSLRDLQLTIWGIGAGFVSWLIYSLADPNTFKGLGEGIAKLFLKDTNASFYTCANKTSAFLMIGLLLGFFLSFVLRYNDGVRKNDWKSLLKTLGLSLLSGAIGMASFAVGALILCGMASTGITPNHWYCSLPAYLIFSICVSLSLSIKSSIPLKSALLGGIGASVIGFLVLYFSNIKKAEWKWLEMLFNFIIYGGGLGASLVTVRTLAERYFLVIKNGIKAGTRIPIHKWMNATGGGNTVTIGMTEKCEIQMTWEKSNKVAKEHVQLYVDHQRSQAMMRPLVNGVVFNSRTELPMGKPLPLSNNDTFTVGDTQFQYVEN